MTDLHLFQTPDGGDLLLYDNRLRVSDGVETLCYLALFGGNEDDSGSGADLPHQWWGNLNERNLARRYRSETQWFCCVGSREKRSVVDGGQLTSKATDTPRI